MGETHQQEQQRQQEARPTSRFGIKNMGGEIVEVQGGHIVRSIGRKDRHSKVCTAKGPRDRRVRLSAHTAIQFYDVQDRLGYDRPSKAVDWLIKKAKTAIDELAELPAWHPTADAITTSKAASDSAPPPPKTRSVTEQEPMSEEREYQLPVESLPGTGSDIMHRRPPPQPPTRTMESMQQHQASSFLPASLDSDSIANTIKSFFPLVASAEAASSSPMQFQNYPPDLLSRTSSHTQDLRLSLQSFQDPNLLHRHHHEQQQHHQNAQNEQLQLLFSGTPHHHYLGFDGSSSGWTEHHQQAELGRFQRMVAWNAADTTPTGNGGGGSGGGGFVFNALPLPPPEPLLQPLFSQNQFLTQRGTLQSNNSPSARAWIDPAALSNDQISQFYQHQSAMSGQGFTTPGVVFSGFRIPGQIQGEEEHGGIHNKPSASSDTRC